MLSAVVSSLTSSPPWRTHPKSHEPLHVGLWHRRPRQEPRPVRMLSAKQIWGIDQQAGRQRSLQTLLGNGSRLLALCALARLGTATFGYEAPCDSDHGMGWVPDFNTSMRLLPSTITDLIDAPRRTKRVESKGGANNQSRAQIA
jgi:hypothetical protein